MAPDVERRSPVAGVPIAPGASVLVVDDTEGNRYTVSRLLRGAGMRVTEAETAAEAMRHLEQQVPDLIVLDINLPDASGYDLCRTIKSAPATAAVPVMHVSASYVTNADRAYGLEYGADAYLTHPLDPDVFVATVRALLRAEGDRARLYEAEHRARRAAEATAARATLLQDLTAALARTMSAAEVSEVVLGRAVAALEAAVGVVAVTTPDGTEVEVLASADPRRADAQWQRVPLSDRSPMGVAIRTRRPVALDTAAEIEAAFPGHVDLPGLRAGGRPCSLYAAPMVVDRGEGERVHGAIALLWDEERHVGPIEAALLTAVADQCAQALERARLYAAEREARTAAEQASRAKSELLSTRSHELRTPLNSVLGHLGLVDDGVYGPITEAQRAALARARRSAVYLTGLINDLLNFARLESGRVDVEVRDVALGGPDGILADVELLVEMQAAAKGVALAEPRASASPALARLRVTTDAEKLRIILVNLVTNAIKFTDAGGTVTLAADPEPRDGVVRLTVRDTGRGIEATQLGRIFEPFVQVDRTRTHESQQGVGLGLAISLALARAMGGDIVAESTPGIGSTFSLLLPATPDVGPLRA
jgi:signal transduction histidine kinase